MSKPADVLIAGLGAVGSAAAFQLSRRGVRVTGIDRFTPPHTLGSSHGETRITRLALGEGPQYFQFAQRSHEIWRELEEATGSTLLRETGCLVYGSCLERQAAHGADDFLQTTIDVARNNRIPHEVLDFHALRTRFPQFKFREDENGCLEHSAGLVHPEACISAQLELARRAGARILAGETIQEWHSDSTGVTVRTDKGSHSASRLLICAGAWSPQLALPLRTRTEVFRQILFWFETDGPSLIYQPDQMPVFIRVPDSGSAMFYGFPAINGPTGGIKIAGEQFDQPTDPDRMSTDIEEFECRQMHQLASPHLHITGKCLRAVACKYTVTPDFHFLLDRHPDTANVWIASACSGHGFKHSAAVGEAMAQLVMGERSTYDLAPFALGRLPEISGRS